MDARPAPLLPFALAYLAGAAFAHHLSHLSIPLLLSLAVLPLTLGRRVGFLLSCCALGLLTTALHLETSAPMASHAARSQSRVEAWRPGAPVEVRARVTSPWRRTQWGWSGRVEVDRLKHRARPPRPGPAGEPPAAEERVELVELGAYLSLSGPEPPPAPGSVLRVRGYLTRRPGFANGGRREAGPWRLSVPSRRLVAVERGPGPLDRLAETLRRRLAAALERGSGPEPPGPGQGPVQGRGGHRATGGGLVRALVLGDPSGLDPAAVRALRRSGLGHLLALSGLHLGMVVGLAWLAGARLPRLGRLGLGIGAAGAYLLLAGPRPSLLRAFVLTSAGAAALALERRPSPLNALCLAVVLLVAADPAVVGDLGFRLTVSATAGILGLVPWWWPGAAGGPLPEAEDPASPAAAREPVPRGHRRLLRGPVLSLAVTAAAQVATLPWALPAFHGLSPLAPLLNLVAVPWTALCLAASLSWALLALVSPAVAAALLSPLALLALPFAWPARAPAAPWWFLPLAATPLSASCLAAGLALLPGAWSRMRSARVRGSLGAFAAACLALAWWTTPTPLEPAGEPRLVMLDVGQGDALVLRDGPRALLVDGGGLPGFGAGGGIGARVLLPALLRLGVRRLDAVVPSHGDRDHCGGLVEIASWLPVEEAWLPAGLEGARDCFEGLLAVPGLQARRLAAGGVGRLGRWRWRVLHPEWPASEAVTASRRGSNGDSLVLALELGEDGGRGADPAGDGPGPLRVLLTGDLDAEGERRLLARFRHRARDLLRADVLKVAHHGSRSSSGLPFLAAVFRGRDPEEPPPLALISAGRGNVYGHPSVQVLERLERYGARVWRTDLEGWRVVDRDRR